MKGSMIAEIKQLKKLIAHTPTMCRNQSILI